MAETPLTHGGTRSSVQGQGAETEMLGGKAKSSLSKQRQVWPVGATSIHALGKPHRSLICKEAGWAQVMANLRPRVHLAMQTLQFALQPDVNVHKKAQKKLQNLLVP